jgi:hypothetical protein
MHSLVIRTLAGLVTTGVSLGVAAAPAEAAETTKFKLSIGGVVAYGTYKHFPSTPKQQTPSIRISGTLVARGSCAALQVARSGPADGVEWQTSVGHCGAGRSRFQVQTSYMFRGVKPPVRLCAGRTLRQAERGQQCDQYRPPTA